MPREDAGYKGISGNGSYLWCKFATITTGFSYINYPICFEVSCRGGIKSTLQVRFRSTDNLDPALDRFITDNDTNFYIKKTAPRTWELYCMYNGTSAWGSFSLYRVTNMYNLPINTTLVNLETEPTDKTQCTLCSERIEEQGDGYIRYSSGIQICWGAINVNTNEETDISFSKPFIDTKYCIISTASSWGRYSNSYPKGPGVFGMYANFTSSGKCDVYWQAIGKWK